MVLLRSLRNFCSELRGEKKKPQIVGKCQFRYGVCTVDQDVMETDLECESFPDIDGNGFTEIIMDNASHQDKLRDFIEACGCQTPGFA